MTKEEQIYEIYEQIKYSTGCYDNDARSAAEILYDYLGYRKFEWISVEDKLPEEDVRVLVYLNTNRSYTKIDTDRRFEGKWVRWASDVTYWMPLPAPPKEN